MDLFWNWTNIQGGTWFALGWGCHTQVLQFPSSPFQFLWLLLTFKHSSSSSSWSNLDFPLYTGRALTGLGSGSKRQGWRSVKHQRHHYVHHEHKQHHQNHPDHQNTPSSTHLQHYYFNEVFVGKKLLFQLGREGRDLENTVCFLAANKCDANPDKYRHRRHLLHLHHDHLCKCIISIFSI